MDKLLAKYASLYNKWTEKEILAWENKKSFGLVRFILFEGVLKWGLFSFVIYCLINLARNLPKEKSIFFEFHFTIIVWLIGSVVYGYVMWIGTNKSYEIKCEKS